MLTLAMSQLKRHLITDSNLLLTVNILGDILTFLQSQEKVKTIVLMLVVLQETHNSANGVLCKAWRLRDNTCLM